MAVLPPLKLKANARFMSRQGALLTTALPDQQPCLVPHSRLRYPARAIIIGRLSHGLDDPPPIDITTWIQQGPAKH
jgi:hypothetical protein